MPPITLSTARAHLAVSGVQITKSTTAPQRIDSLSLLSGNRELIIEHGGFEYRLRRTQNDKLILTK